MMDWLYKELDPAQTDTFKAHVSTCSSCGEELRSLEATREAFSELPSEEPPASVLAILLHEAARNAPAKVPAHEPIDDRSGGLWAWFVALLQPIAAHPAAAAIASLVLVAGVAGTLYVTKGDQHIAQPELAKSNSDERYVRVQPGSPSALADNERGLATGDSFGEGAAELAVLDAGAPELAAAAPGREARSGEKGFAADLLPADDQGTLRQRVAANKENEQDARAGAKPNERRDFRQTESTGKLAAKNRKKTKPSLDAPPTTNAISGTDPLISLDEGGEAVESEDDGDSIAADRPAAKTDDVSRGASGGSLALEKSAGTDKDETYRVYKEREAQWAKTQRKALSQAVKKEDCRRAARIANDILDRNKDYYTKSVKGSKDVKRCQWYVSDERKRRTTTKESQRATKRKKAAGVPSKAKAAPRDEAAESAE